MRKSGVMAVALSVVLALLGAAAPTGPRVVCPNPVWDFGKQPQFKKLTHDFIIRNEGDAELRITDVQPSCQCQAALPEKRNLKPGEQTSIRVIFETNNMRKSVHKPITVRTNDPARPSFQLIVKGFIQPPFWLSPPEVNLGSIGKHAAGTPQEFSIIISPKARVDVRSVEPTGTFLEVERIGDGPIMREDGSQEIKYRVVLRKGHPVGLVRESITVTTDLIHKRTALLGVNGEVTGEIRISPRTFRLGRIRRGEEATRTLDVVKSGKPDLVIEKVILKPESIQNVFTVEVVPVKKGAHYRIRISVKPDAPAKYHRGRVVIMTNCQGERVHQAYFYVSIKR
jgi:hypothetical protein